MNPTFYGSGRSVALRGSPIEPTSLPRSGFSSPEFLPHHP